MRTLTRLLAVLAVLTLAGACADERGGDMAVPTTTSPRLTRAAVFFGAVSMTGDRLAIALDPPAGGGAQRVRAFVTDGRPGGDAEWFEGEGTAGGFALTSASGKARLEGRVGDADASGTVTLADGIRRSFYTIPATFGAGIYDVEVGADGTYRGTSTDGWVLEATQEGDYVEGTLTKGGERETFRVADLSRVFRYDVAGGQPDRYTLVVARHGLVLLGRGGGEAMKRGAPSGNVISLDLAASRKPSPGLYYGELDQATDQFVMVVGTPNAQGARQVRIYLSDGEPEPEGDIEWFVGAVTGSTVNLTSASGDARIEGRLSDQEFRGMVTLPGGRSHAFFAVPAGDGAGIYEVEVTGDGTYVGRSEDGASFTLRQRGPEVSGTITTRDGEQIALAAYDLTRVFRYSVEGSKPGRYLAFASPGGRYLIGRSGNVRGGTAGNNIIGLDKAC